MDKSFEEMNHKQFYKLIKKLIEKIKYDFKENNLKTEDITFHPKDKTIFDLTFKNIISLVNIIIFIIDNNTSKGIKVIQYLISHLEIKYQNEKIML